MDKSLIVIGSVLLLSGCGDLTPSYSERNSLTHLERYLLDEAWNTLQQQCPQVKDAEKVVLSMNRTDMDWCRIDHECEKYGWAFKAQIRVTKDDQLHFYRLGHGNKPGIIAMMQESSEMCGWPSMKSYNNFVAVEW